MALDHGSALDLRLACDFADPDPALDRAAAHPAALPGSRPPRGGGRCAAAGAAARSDRPIDRLRRDATDQKQLQLLDAITKATQRGESLTRQLLAFSRRQMLQPTVIDLAERLPELKDMLGRSLRGDIEIRVLVSKRPCRVKVDASEFELALLNLAVNARD